MGSGDSYEEDATEPADNLPPAKRQKTNDGGSAASPAVATHPEGDLDPLDDMSDVSSDTSGDVPSSPIHARLDEDEFQEQVTVCVWEGCKAGDQGDMDKLVDHIHNDHIENRQKKYTCEWRGCGRQGLPHASGYALKAHMRSHTREKPFYCYLPGMLHNSLNPFIFFFSSSFYCFFLLTLQPSSTLPLFLAFPIALYAAKASLFHRHPLKSISLTLSFQQSVIAHSLDPTPLPNTCALSTRPKPFARPTPCPRACRAAVPAPAAP